MFYIDCGVTSNISNNPSRGVAWWGDDSAFQRERTFSREDKRILSAD